ncbi:TauD/TfdA dioxygenase family protein [Nocardia aurantia]|uniref:(S)-phenoxypropionate/alpha-ketoglutarate-dioxygenase n=1 Tax=Nocardia aurantia TaxID=2585199 RepID=A0A7K0DQ43_9NOCA|nr:TauD/TfdA family dioxygenase [Nocardia aurantia]MQY27708.1 (S)-phenoxypropionate/alpha-ketoglutarate-dioxygenase [Nocardia aurantia]
MTVTTTEISDHIGLEVTGMTGADLVGAEAAGQLRTALDRYGVVVYREAHITDAELVALSRHLGEVVVAPFGGEKEFPEVQAVTRDPSKSVLAAYREGTFFWHIDGATDEVPQQATLLTAKVVADDGGDTEFANTFAAYEALSEAEKAEIDDLRVVHSFAHSQELANPEPTAKQRAAWDRVPTRVHPLVWTRANGRKSLLIGATAASIVGWSEEESRALLDRLLDWSGQPRFSLRHQWKPGDLVVWDNTGMLHRAQPYDAGSSRLMHRTTLVGEEAVA